MPVAALFTYGIFAVLEIAFLLILTLIGIFLGNIILFDSIALAVAAGLTAYHGAGLHPAYCLVAGLVAFGLLYWLQHTRAGFWLIGLLLSAFWAFVFGFVAYCVTSDMTWCYVIMALGFVLMVYLHLNARD